MIVIGIDPGSLLTGYGVVLNMRGRMSVLACGTIRNKPGSSMPDRLKVIFESLQEIIQQYHPDELAIETAFYGKNAQSALKLGHARGAAILAAVLRDVPTFEYSPREVKKAVVGIGTASKIQVRAMMNMQFKLENSSRNFDMTDALAVAICHLHRQSGPHRPHSISWKAYLAGHPEKLVRSPAR